MKCAGGGLAKVIQREIPINLSEAVFVCIGTDRSTGDSLGPLVGTGLERLGYHVIGTIHKPCHGQNLWERIKEIPEGKTVIAIDSCLGQMTSVGLFTAKKGHMRPGAGVDRTDLPNVGDYHITGIVNVGGFMEYFVLQNTRLSLVMDMADTIVKSIHEAATYQLAAAAKEDIT